MESLIQTDLCNEYKKAFEIGSDLAWDNYYKKLKRAVIELKNASLNSKSKSVYHDYLFALNLLDAAKTEKNYREKKSATDGTF